MTTLRYENFSLVVGNRTIVEPMSLTVNGPGVVALLGPSGAGKSSLLRATRNLILRKQDHWSHSGDIQLNGKSVFTSDRVTRQIGFIHQKPRMLAGSVADNVAFALKHTTRLSKTEIQERIMDVLEKVGLIDEIESPKMPAWCLSGGQAQRLAVARAIALEPSVLLMDEPCSSLDPVKSGKMENLIREISRQRLILLVTHDTRLAQRSANQVAFIMPGENGSHLCAQGSTERIFAKPPTPEVCEFIRFGTHGNCPLVPKTALKRLFLFVCGGNTSRSPMAQAICNQELAHFLGINDADLTSLGIQAQSAGLQTNPGKPLSEGARDALSGLGYQPHEHRTRDICPDLATSADVIFCMTKDQASKVVGRFPEQEHKVQLLDPIADIANPHGGDQTTYNAVATRIRDAVRWQLARAS